MPSSPCEASGVEQTHRQQQRSIVHRRTTEAVARRRYAAMTMGPSRSHAPFIHASMEETASTHLGNARWSLCERRQLIASTSQLVFQHSCGAA